MTVPPVLGVVTALTYEAAAVRSLLRVHRRVTTPSGQLWQGDVYGQAVVVLCCGMGLERATRATHWLLQHYTLHSLINVGFAGGLQERLCTGTALVPVCCRYVPENGRLPAREEAIIPDARLADLATRAASKAMLPIGTGALLSVTKVLPDAAAKTAMGRATNALAVDMEAFGIGQMARTYGVPFMVLRTILDTRDDTLPGQMQYWTTVTGSLRPLALCCYLVRQPGTVQSLWQLWHSSRIARRNLTAWLKHFFILWSTPNQGQQQPTLAR